MVPYPEIDPVIFSVGPISVHWYGMMYLIGLGFGYFIATRDCRRPWSPARRDQLDDLLFYCAMGVILGGRLGSALFYNFEKFISDPIWLFRVWEGGMAFHGGLLGVGAACWYFAWRNKQSLGHVFDFIAPTACVGLGLGRVGNFIGQELWGRAADVPWAMVFPRDPLQIARHPSQLYQAFLEGIVLFGIVYWFSRKQRPAFSVAGVFIAVYGICRFIVEYFREPDSHIGMQLGGLLTRGQILSFPMIVGGFLLVAWAYKREQGRMGHSH
jgi:phosphatidylglycerol:prolipoprotein diacylglycerol transferase